MTKKKKRVGDAGLAQQASFFFTLNHLAFPCGTYPYQLHNFDFRDSKYSQKRPRRQLEKMEAGGGDLGRSASTGFFFFSMLRLQVSLKKRQEKDEKHLI